MNEIPFDDMLREMVDRQASDLYLTVDAPPSILVDGELSAIDTETMTHERMIAISRDIMSDKQWEELMQGLEMNLACVSEGQRFRVCVYFQRNALALVARLIRQDILSFDQLDLPGVLKDLVMLERGLILVTGATGSGKSTTLATMIDWRNSNSTGHIVTVEDPIEFTHQHKKCIVSQREIGMDTHSFHDAIKSALRQAPRVILIGEIRDMETAQFVLHAAETGHLVLSTLHTTNANQTLERMINFFPAMAHTQIYAQMSLNLRAVVSQRLLPKKSGGRIAAFELLINTPRSQELIQRGDIAGLKDMMRKGGGEGMVTFDMCLYDYVKRDIITVEEAMQHADSANDLKLRLRGLGGPGFA